MKKIERITELERKYVNQVLDNEFRSSKNYCMVTELERKFAELFDVEYAIAMVNGTTTLHAALEAAGVGEGDEVICPPPHHVKHITCSTSCKRHTRVCGHRPRNISDYA